MTNTLDFKKLNKRLTQVLSSEGVYEEILEEDTLEELFLRHWLGITRARLYSILSDDKSGIEFDIQYPFSVFFLRAFYETNYELPRFGYVFDYQQLRTLKTGLENYNIDKVNIKGIKQLESNLMMNPGQGLCGQVAQYKEYKHVWNWKLQLAGSNKVSNNMEGVTKISPEIVTLEDKFLRRYELHEWPVFELGSNNIKFIFCLNVGGLRNDQNPPSSCSLKDKTVNEIANILKTEFQINLLYLDALQREFAIGKKQIERKLLKSKMDLKQKLRNGINGVFLADEKTVNIYLECIFYASLDYTVLFTGETGTGKTLFTKILHDNHPSRKKHEFVDVSCSTQPDQLLESNLFGYTEKSAMVESDPKGKIGDFEYADGGTLLLDEIGHMSPNLQVKILKALDKDADGRISIRRIGSNKPRKLDVRVIAATTIEAKRNLIPELLRRIDAIKIEIPPLRERPDDIELLAQLFLRKHCKEILPNLDPPPRFTAGVISWLRDREYPANVDDLEDTIIQILVHNHNRKDIDISMDDLPPEMLNKPVREIKEFISKGIYNLDKISRSVAEMADGDDQFGSEEEKAKALGISRGTFRKLIGKRQTRK